MPATAGHPVSVGSAWPAREPGAWRWEALASAIGVTRLAVLTGLDVLGIPVVQAVRPAGRTLSVAQGKGLSTAAARASAMGEALEQWHAERTGPGERVETVAAVAGELGYPLGALPVAGRTVLSDMTRLEWTPATVVRTGDATWVPTELLRLDARLEVMERWRAPLFSPSTTGLGTGRSLDAALRHGLCEWVERDAIARAGQIPGRRIAINSAMGRAGAVAGRMRAAKARVELDWLDHPTGWPVIQARVRDETVPVWCGGYGCHPNAEVAALRALLEAAQSRLTFIAGTRDDIPAGHYAAMRVRLSHPASDSAGEASAGAEVDYRDLPGCRAADRLSAAELAGHIAAVTGWDPIAVELTRPDLDVPVVHVFCPGLRLPGEQ